MMARIRVGLLALGAALFVGIAVLSSALPAQLSKAVMPIFIVAFLLAYVLFLVHAFRGKKVFLDVADDRLVLDEGRGGVFPLGGAALGLWQMASVGVTAGSALHLSDGQRTLRVGGRDHRLDPTFRATALPVDGVDVFLSASDFEALLAMIPGIFTGAARGALPPQPVRCALLPNPFRARGVLSTMAPWIGTLLLLFVVFGVLGELESANIVSARLIAVPLFVLIVGGGIALTIVRSSRKNRAEAALEADVSEVRLRDLQTGQLVAAAPHSAVSITRGTYEILVRGAVFHYAMIAVHVPGHEAITLGVHDTRFRWIDGGARVSAPHYIVGTPDWVALVDLFRLRAALVVSGDAT